MVHGAQLSSRFQPPSKVAHELNNDLGIILAECDLLEDLLNNNIAGLERLEVIKKAVRRMADKLAQLQGEEPLPSNISPQL